MKKYFIFLFFISIPVFADNLECVVGDYELYAIFTPKTVVCDDNEFLPANSLTCQQCPNGYTCTGGSFTFNEQKASGIDYNQKITNSANNVCALNFPSELYAVYTPKTVTLNFDNGNGTNTSTTCTYDGLVNLPEIPTRPGYAFKGWKLVTHE